MTTRFAIMVFSVDDIVHIHIYHCLQKGDWNTLTGKKFKNKNEKKTKKFITLTLSNQNPFGWVWKLELKIIHFKF